MFSHMAASYCGVSPGFLPFLSSLPGGVQPHCFFGPQPALGMKRDMTTQTTTTARRIQMPLSMLPSGLWPS